MEGTGLAASASASSPRATGEPSAERRAAERRARAQTQCWQDGKWRLARLPGIQLPRWARWSQAPVPGFTPLTVRALRLSAEGSQVEAHRGWPRWLQGGRETAGGGCHSKYKTGVREGQSCLSLSKVTTLEFESLGLWVLLGDFRTAGVRWQGFSLDVEGQVWVRR